MCVCRFLRKERQIRLKGETTLALAIALICRSFGLQHLQQHHGLDLLYSAAKVGMSLTGMCVLGIWLAHTKVATRDLWQSSKIFLIKIIWYI